MTEVKSAVAERIQPVMNAPALTVVSELKYYLGMLSYYNRFLPNVSTCWSYFMNCCGRAWGGSGQWSMTGHARLQRKYLKFCLCSPTTTQVSRLYFLVTRLPMVLELCYHTLVTGGRKCQSGSRHISLMPVSDATPNRIKIFRVCKFHKYLKGRKFRIQTDHKPLLGLLGVDHPIPVMS